MGRGIGDGRRVWKVDQWVCILGPGCGSGWRFSEDCRSVREEEEEHKGEKTIDTSRRRRSSGIAYFHGQRIWGRLVIFIEVRCAHGRKMPNCRKVSMTIRKSQRKTSTYFILDQPHHRRVSSLSRCANYPPGEVSQELQPLGIYGERPSPGCL